MGVKNQVINPASGKTLMLTHKNSARFTILKNQFRKDAGLLNK